MHIHITTYTYVNYIYIHNLYFWARERNMPNSKAPENKFRQT